MKRFLILNLFIILMLLLFSGDVFAIPNNNPALKEIRLSNGELNPQFDYLTTTYSVVVSEDVQKMEIEAIPLEETSKVEIIGDIDLKLGSNKVIILVTAEDGETTRTYTLNITRGNIEKANTNLKSIDVEGLKLIPNFTNSKTEYVVVIDKNRTSVKVKAVPENANAKVSVTGNEDFTRKDNLIKIIVTAEDGITQKEYNIIASKKINEEEQNLTTEDNIVMLEQNNIKVINIALLILTTIIVSIVIYIVKKRKEKKNEKE